MDVLVLNCGSSSIKAAVVCAETGKPAFDGIAERLGSPEARLKYTANGARGEVALGVGDHAAAMTAILDASNTWTVGPGSPQASESGDYETCQAGRGPVP